MDANANPDTPAKSERSFSDAVDTSVDLANTVVTVVREVGEMLNSIPYVKSLSGVILQIIKVRDEIKANKQRCVEIIEKVLRMSKSIYEKLGEVAKSNQREKLSRLEYQLNEHTRALTAVYNVLEKHRSSRSRFSCLINRGLDELNAHDRRLDELNTQLILDIIFRITMEQAGTSNPISNPHAYSLPSSEVPDHILPPKPYLMVEREAEFNTALKVLGAGPSRVAILGGGGFGKTTLARAILYDPQISEHYKFRYFLSCEAVPDADTLLSSISNILGIKATPAAMLASIRRRLETSTTLLCLDNFETPWEPPATRERIEDILASISDIPHLSLIITLRGTQRPSKVAWSHPQLPPLPNLSSDSAHKILQSICPNHDVDDFTQQLLDGVDGIPLAITLISNLLRDGECSQELWTRWTKERTAVIENGGEGRQSNLNTSIALSMNSPRMTKDPDCLTVLAALSLLPDGFPSASVERLGECLGTIGIRRVLQTLRAVALIKPEDRSPSHRIQMLSPIRFFCHQFLSSEISLVLGLLSEYYIGMMCFAKGGESNPSAYAEVAPEIRNVHSIFQKVYADGYQRDMGRLMSCTAILTDWSRYVGYLNQDTIHMALERSSNHPVPRAQCLLAQGRLCIPEAHYAKAEELFREAAELFKRISHTIGEAESLFELGRALGNKRQLDQTEIAFKASLALYTQANHTHGQATVRQKMGQLYMDKGQYPEAEENLMSAFGVFKQMRHLSGLGDAALHLAWLHDDLNNTAQSETFAVEALSTAKKTNDALEEGNALVYLGRAYMRTDRITDARQTLEQALAIFKQLNDPASHLNAAFDLGEVYIQSDQLSMAEALLTASAKVDLDIVQIPWILTTLGWLYICANRVDKAETHLDKALLLFRKFDEIFGEADALTHLGALYFRANRQADAEQTLDLIPSLGRWRNIDMRRLWVLGDIHIAKGQLEDAEASLDEALACARHDKCSYQQGNILRSMGTLHVKRGHLNLAIDKFQRALDFHRKAQWISEHATDLRRLGEVYEMSGKFEEAAAVFEKAEDLMDGVREARKLAL